MSKKQPKNTIQFIAGGELRKTALILHGETVQDAARRAGIMLGERLCLDGSVLLANYEGAAGEARIEATFK